MDVLAQTASWNFSTPAEYTYDSDEIEISEGIAQSKSAYEPGIDWINTDSNENNWGSRKEIVISNSGAEISDYQILVTIDTSGENFNNDCSDLRFTSSDYKTEIPFFLESGCASQETLVWVKVPTVAASPDVTKIYMYYGNENATNESDGSETFIFFDDFSGDSLDTSKWTATGSVTIANNIATLDRNSTDVILRTNSSFSISQNFVAECKYQHPSRYRNRLYLTTSSGGESPVGSDYGIFSPSVYWKGSWTGVNLTPNEWYVVRWILTPSDYVWQILASDYSSTIVNRSNGATINNATYFNFRGTESNDSDSKIDWARVRLNTQSTITGTTGSEELLFQTSPAITPVNSQGYSSLSAFTQTLGDGSSGEVKYQISPDDGSSWYWYTSGAWTQTSSGVLESNSASTVNDNIASFDAGEAPKQFLWRAYLVSDGSQQPKLDLIELTHIWDTAQPDEVTSLTQSKKSQGSDDITSNNWYNSATPYFTWDEPDDNAGEGESESGVDGYYVYFGPSATADPTTAGTYQSSETYTASVSSSGTYYLFIETKDVAGNINHVNQDPQNPDEPLFIYKYDNADPTSPLYVSSSPSGYSRTNSFTFSWPTTGASMAQDTGGSLLSGYQYKINSSSWSNTLSNGSVTIEDQGETGVNIFYLRAIDTAGNYDDTPVQTNFYYNASAPTAPRNLSVDPSSSQSNSFSFSWDQPSSYNGSIDGYYYSINAFPTLTNTSYTQEDSLETGPYATQQGENTFYIVAKDEAGNYDFASCNNISGNTDVDGCAKVVFTANTSAPGIPTNLSAFDISNRDTQEYATTLKWTAPQDQGTGFDGYEIYRSANGATFTAVGSTSGTTYADTDLDSRIYYYFVKAKDNAGQYSSASTTISITPTGRYTTAPELTEDPVAVAKAFSCNITWETDRDSSSFIYVDKELENLSGSKGVGQPEKTSKHSVDVTGLEPQTTYYYQAMWEDVDGNQGRSEIYSFQTSVRPAISNVKFSSITLNSAILSWDSSTISSSTVNYGKTSAYGSTINENSSSQTTSHTVFIQNLDHSSTYHVQINATDTDNNSISSDNYTFDTLPMPKIENLRFESIQAATTTVRAVWKTNVETSSEVVFSAPSGTLSRSDANLSTDHELIVDNLADSSVYSIVAKGRDQFGNQAQSDVNSFTTPIDTRAPSVYDIVVETSNVGSGREDESQVLVSWRTDEPATSRVEYGEGISGDQYESKTTEDAAMTNSHLVVVSGLSDSSPYHLRVCSKDKGANETCSTDDTIVPGESKKSLFSIIVGTFKRTFGWLEKVL